MPRRVSQAAAEREVSRLASARVGETAFVGVDGPGCAGKSRLARRLAAAMAGASLVSIDHFCGPRVQEWDWPRFTEQVVLPLVAGHTARYQQWDWDSEQGGPWHEVEPGSLVVIEGVSATRAEVAVPWALRIWVECPRELRLARALQRDGPAMKARWIEHWIPSENAYIASQRPQGRADLIVSGNEPD